MSKIKQFLIVLALCFFNMALIQQVSARNYTSKQTTIGYGLADMEFDSTRNRLYVSSSATNEVLVLDSESLSIIKRISLAHPNYGSSVRISGLEISSDGLTLFVAVSGYSLIQCIDLNTLTVTKYISTGNMYTGVESGSPYINDIVELEPNKLYVSFNKNSYTSEPRIIKIDLNNNNALSFVGGESGVSSPYFAKNSTANQLFALSSKGMASTIYKLDLNQEGVPVVAQTPVSINSPAIYFDNQSQKLFLQTGEVFDVNLNKVGTVVGPRATIFTVEKFAAGPASGQITVLKTEDDYGSGSVTNHSLNFYDTNTLTRQGVYVSSCDFGGLTPAIKSFKKSSKAEQYFLMSDEAICVITEDLLQPSTPTASPATPTISDTTNPTTSNGSTIENGDSIAIPASESPAMLSEVSGYVTIKSRNQKLKLAVHGTYDGSGYLEVSENRPSSPRISLRIPVDSITLNDSGYYAMQDSVEVSVSPKLIKKGMSISTGTVESVDSKTNIYCYRDDDAGQVWGNIGFIKNAMKISFLINLSK